MSLFNKDKSASTLAFTSSVKEDIWKGKKKGSEHEWWYFDALSDDASEAIVIIFLDNFIFSPRFNAACSGEAAGGDGQEIPAVPAVAFTYYLHGKPIYRSITEFDAEAFKASDQSPGCKIGDSSFEFTSAPYGSGYAIVVDLPLPRNKRLRGRFEWLSIESDLAPTSTSGVRGGQMRNFVAPRSDVTGRITVIDSRGKREKRKFRGTGYHDNNSDRRWMPDTIDEWFWGRAHFPFATGIFYRYAEIGRTPISKLILVRDGNLEDYDAVFKQGKKTVRDGFGLGLPESVSMAANDFEMVISKPKVVESSFFYMRSICEMSLSNGGRDWKTQGIAEYMRPEPLKSRWLRRLIDLRIGKSGKTALLP